MTAAAEGTGAAAELDTGRVRAWLDAELGDRQPVTVEAIATGASNDVYRLRRGGDRLVLRRPPAGHHDPDLADWIVLREARVLRALEGTGVPHPRVVAACDDPGVLGSNFYVMEEVDGFTPKDPLPPPFDTDVAARRGLGLELVDALAALANVDWRAAGLEGFGTPEGFLERQVDRWLSQLDRYRDRDLPGLEEVAAWLEDRRPEMGPPAIMHGDYQFINTIFHHGAPARMAAIVDWEQSTIGDPLLDLGWMFLGWVEPGEQSPTSGYLSAREGLPSRAELIERYEARTGRAVTDLDYYVNLARFKLACVLEGAYQRWVDGRSDDDRHRQMGDVVLALLADAVDDVRAAA